MTLLLLAHSLIAIKEPIFFLHCQRFPTGGQLSDVVQMKDISMRQLNAVDHLPYSTYVITVLFIVCKKKDSNGSIRPGRLEEEEDTFTSL